MCGCRLMHYIADTIKVIIAYGNAKDENVDDVYNQDR